MRNQTQELRAELLPRNQPMCACLSPGLPPIPLSSCSFTVVSYDPLLASFFSSALLAFQVFWFFPPRGSPRCHLLQALLSEDESNAFWERMASKGPDRCCPALSCSLCRGGDGPWQEPTVSQANELSETRPCASPLGQVIIMRAVSGG